MKKNTIIIGVVVIAVLALIAAVVNAYAKNKTASDPNYTPPTGTSSYTPGTTTTSGTSSTPTTTSVSLDYNKSLGLGSRGNEVKELQRLFNNSRYVTTPLVEDGIFGSKTLTAVILVMGFGTASTSLNAFNAALAKDASKTSSTSFLTSWFK